MEIVSHKLNFKYSRKKGDTFHYNKAYILNIQKEIQKETKNGNMSELYFSFTSSSFYLDPLIHLVRSKLRNGKASRSSNLKQPIK